MTKWTTRALGGAAVVAGVLGSSAGAAEAAVIERVHYSDTFSDVYFDCGFPVEVEGEFSGTFHLRVGEGKTESAFFLHDNYQYREVHTNPANGKFFVVYGNGLFHETKAIRVEGSIFQFNAIEAWSASRSSSTPKATTCPAASSSRSSMSPSAGLTRASSSTPPRDVPSCRELNPVRWVSHNRAGGPERDWPLSTRCRQGTAPHGAHICRSATALHTRSAPDRALRST